MKEKEEESDIIKSVLTQLNESEVTVETNLNKNLMDLKVKYLVIYTFTSLNWPDVLLSKQKTFLSPSSEQKPCESEHKTWLMPDIQKTMRDNLKIFKKLVDLNNSKSVKFIVTSKDMENNPGSCILLYENESNEPVCFTPPSRPDSSVIKDIRNSRVVLKVSPACAATEELKLLYKTKEEEDWTCQTVSEKQDTVTLTDLRPDTEYQIKCTAVGKLNYTVDSDVTRLTVINQNLIKAKESVIEDLSWAVNKCSSLLENSRGTVFSTLYKKIQDLQKNCQTYRQEFSDGVKTVIQSVKACEKESSALEDLLQAHDESPFNGKSLKEWIMMRETELNTVNELHQQLVDLGAETDRSLDSYLSDIQVENVFSYTFTSLELPDELLNEQNPHMNPQMRRNPLKRPDVASQTWLTRGVREKMRENLKIFKELMTSCINQDTKFFVSIKDHKQHPGSCILLCKNGCNKAVCFTPPSKPDSPVVEDVRERRVALRLSPACAATEELKLLYKTKEEKDWTFQTVLKNQDTATLTDLRPGTEYQIKCAAVGKLNCTTKSDVTTIITKNKTDLIKKSILIDDGNPARYRLQTTTNILDQSESYRKMLFGERDKNKHHKTILLVGETGSGQTTLINVMVNYMLGVQRKDKVWFEVTDDQKNETSAHSQTSIITVYGVYLQESPIDLTIIDTPGYGNTHGVELEKQSLHRLNTDDLLCEIDAVCFVMNATQNCLSDKQIYIFDAVQSLFGRDIAENIVLLFTHSDGMPPRNALTAVKEAEFKCAVDEQNQPVYFLFNNRQSDACEEEYEMFQEQSWNLSFTGMSGLVKCIDHIKPKTLETTRNVLQNQEQLEANVFNLQSRVQVIELKKHELKQTQEYVKSDKNFEYEVEVHYKEKAYINSALAKMALCCTFCEENCHFPGCRWFGSVSQCSMMKDNHCTVCTNKCHYSKHVKTSKIYVTKTKKEKRTNRDLEKKYDQKIRDNDSLLKKLEEELQELESEKIRQVIKVFECVNTLQSIALNTDSLLVLQHVDFLIEKLKEINEPEKAKTLEDIKKRAEEGKHRALRNITSRLL